MAEKKKQEQGDAKDKEKNEADDDDEEEEEEGGVQQRRDDGDGGGGGGDILARFRARRKKERQSSSGESGRFVNGGIHRAYVRPDYIPFTYDNVTRVAGPSVEGWPPGTNRRTKDYILPGVQNFLLKVSAFITAS